MNLSKEQEKALHRAKALLAIYRSMSLEHQDPKVSEAVIAGDMIADIQYAMSWVYEYPREDVESVRIAALNSLNG